MDFGELALTSSAEWASISGKDDRARAGRKGGRRNTMRFNETLNSPTDPDNAYFMFGQPTRGTDGMIQAQPIPLSGIPQSMGKHRGWDAVAELEQDSSVLVVHNDARNSESFRSTVQKSSFVHHIKPTVGSDLSRWIGTYSFTNPNNRQVFELGISTSGRNVSTDAPHVYFSSPYTFNSVVEGSISFARATLRFRSEPYSRMKTLEERRRDTYEVRVRFSEGTAEISVACLDGYSFTAVAERRTHRQAISCDKCGLWFARQRNLARHCRSHAHRHGLPPPAAPPVPERVVIINRPRGTSHGGLAPDGQASHGYSNTYGWPTLNQTRTRVRSHLASGRVESTEDLTTGTDHGFSESKVLAHRSQPGATPKSWSAPQPRPRRKLQPPLNSMVLPSENLKPSDPSGVAK